MHLVPWFSSKFAAKRYCSFFLKKWSLEGTLEHCVMWWPSWLSQCIFGYPCWMMYQLHPTEVYCYVVHWNLRLSVILLQLVQFLGPRGITLLEELHKLVTDLVLKAKNWPFRFFKVHFFSNSVHLTTIHFLMLKSWHDQILSRQDRFSTLVYF